MISNLWFENLDHITPLNTE